MVERVESANAPKQSLEDRASAILKGPMGYGDTGNGFYPIGASMGSPPSWWPDVTHAPTYQEYIAKKYGFAPGLPEAVIAASDLVFVEAYNTFTQRVNTAIGDGVKTQEQADAIGAIVIEAGEYIHDFCEKLPGGHSGRITDHVPAAVSISTSQAELSPEESGREFVGMRGIPGDVVNNLLPTQGYLELEELWPQITRVETYEQYFRANKFRDDLRLAEAVIVASDPALVSQYNQIVEKINQVIRPGVTTKEQEEEILRLIESTRAIIYGT